MMRSSFRIIAWTALALIGVAAIATALFFYQRNTAPKSLPSLASNVAVDLGDQRFMRWNTPQKLPALAFQDATGKAVTLNDFEGRVILLNLWATWCPPCREEMPSLDRLNAKLGGPNFEVIALSIDRNPVSVSQFYDEFGIRTLNHYVDPTTRASDILRAPGIPTTLLIDREGHEIGRAMGPAAWDSPQVEGIIKSTLLSTSDQDSK